MDVNPRTPLLDDHRPTYDPVAVEDAHPVGCRVEPIRAGI